MTFFLTLIAARERLKASILSIACDLLQWRGEFSWLAPDEAVDLPLPKKPERKAILALRDALTDDRVDFFVTEAGNRRKRLLIADMDSTIVTSETLDEMAVEAGVADRVIPITELAMRGEIDFATALRERLALLKETDVSALHRVLSKTRLSKGAATLAATMAAHGARCVLVSGGFTFFTRSIAEKAGFHTHYGNELEVRDGKLTGFVSEPILNGAAKRSILLQECAAAGLEPVDALAVGDGSNDLPMLREAGLGIGYRPKKPLLDSLDNCIIHGDLTAALYAQGYAKEQFVVGSEAG